MSKDRLVLLAVLGVLGAVETYGVVAGRDTISALVRDVFHVHTLAGRTAFTTLWVGFAVWFWRHINNV